MCAMKRNVTAAAKKKAVPVEEPVVEKKAVPVEEKAEIAVAVQEPKVMAKVQQGTMVKLYDEIEDAFVAEFGVLPKVKASNGNCIDSDNKILGDAIDVRIMSWNKQYVVGPGANEAPNELVKYSYSRDYFDDGSGSLNEYVQELKAEGWANASVKEYYEVIGMLTSTEKKSDLINELIQLQLSPTSVKAFNGFRLQTAFKIARGLLSEDDANEITVTAEVIPYKGNTWTKFNFKPKAQS